MKNEHPPESYVLEVFAHYFNQARNRGQDVTICNKHAGDFNFPASFGLRCYENGRDMPLDVKPWFLIDRAIAYPWCYVNNKQPTTIFGVWWTWSVGVASSCCL